MRLQFWQNTPPRKLSDQVKKALSAQFQVESKAMEEMRLLSKSGRYSNRRVKKIRIFAPTLLEGGEASRPSYDDLTEIHGHRRALLFEGRIETDDFGGRLDKINQVYLSDLRAK